MRIPKREKLCGGRKKQGFCMHTILLPVPIIPPLYPRECWGWEFVEQIRLTRNAARCYATGEYIALVGLKLYSLAGGEVLKNTIAIERRAKDE